MKGFLLDTNVLSEFSRSGFPPDANVERWMESTHPDMLFTSVLSIGEIRKGIERLAPGRKRSGLEHWLEADLNGWFGNNLLPVTKEISNRWGMLAAMLEKRGKQLGNIDGLLAATAIEHDLTVVTRNMVHFENLGALILNPWNSRVS